MKFIPRYFETLLIFFKIFLQFISKADSKLSSNDDKVVTVSPKDTAPDPFYPDNKFNIDLSDYLPPNFHITSVVFAVHTWENHTVKVSVVGKERNVYRPFT